MLPAAFLNSYLGEDTDCAVKIRRCKGFSDWWVNQWTITEPAGGEGGAKGALAPPVICKIKENDFLSFH